MARRSLLGSLPVMVLAVCVWTGCKPKSSGTADLEKRCEQLGKACGDEDKHVEKIVAECKEAAAKQVEHGCADKAIALYECYQKQLCGKDDKVWTIDDLRVLADRHGKCVAEQNAARVCTGR